MNSVKQMVENNKQVRFVRFERGELWYSTECGFEFPIPAEDLQGATFNAQDKALLFMRWIKRHINHIEMARLEIVG